MRRAETGGERSIGEQSPRGLTRSSTSEIIYDELATQYENRWESYIRVTVDACRCSTSISSTDVSSAGIA